MSPSRRDWIWRNGFAECAMLPSSRKWTAANQEIGEKMGYSPSSARQAVSQFLRSGDPQIGMLRRFADAMGISLVTLLKKE